MTVGDLQAFLRSMSGFLTSGQAKKLAEDVETFCLGLDPFREYKVGDFTRFLQAANENRQVDTGTASAAAGTERRRPARQARGKVALKTKTDTEAITEAVAKLQGLYERATDPALTHEAIEATVAGIDAAFDSEGLKAVAKGFGVGSSLASKVAAKTKILNRIAERKGRHERNQAIAEGFKPPVPITPEPDAKQPDVVLEVVEDADAVPL